MAPIGTLSLPFSCPSQKCALIKLANIRAAEKVEEKSFGSSHVMQVIYTDDAGRPQTSYLQCKVWLCRGAPLGRGAVGIPWMYWNEGRVSLSHPCYPHQAQQGV